MDDSNAWWTLAPFIRGSCNFVFTPEKLAEFLAKHCQKNLRDAGEDLSLYSTRVEKSTFDAGTVVLKKAPPVSYFNFAALPNELSLLVLESLERDWDGTSTLVSLSMTSKRMRRLVAPYCFAELAIQESLFDRYNRRRNDSMATKVERFIADPVATARARYASVIVFAPIDREQWEEKASRVEILEAFSKSFSHILQERKKNDGSILQFCFYSNQQKSTLDSIEDKLDSLAELVSNIPGLRALSFAGCKGFDQVARGYLNPSRFPVGLHRLVILFQDFSNLFEGCSLPFLRYLRLPALPSPGFLSTSQCKLETLIIDFTHSHWDFQNEPRTEWDLCDLSDFLSLFANSLKILHIEAQTIRLNRWLSTPSEPSTTTSTSTSDIDPIMSQPKIIPFKQLTILRLGNIWISESPKESPQEDEMVGAAIADFFSQAPIRRVYIKDATGKSGQFWDGVEKHRLDQSADGGWRFLERAIIQGGSSFIDQETKKCLERCDFTVQVDRRWRYDL